MAKTYDRPINRNTPWDGDATTGNLPVKGTRVEEYIKSEFDRLSNSATVDSVLDEESPRPVQNAVVTQRLNQLAEGVVTGMEISGEDDVKTLTLLGPNGPIDSVDLPAGGGAGASDATRLVLQPSWNRAIIKQGDDAVLTYRYDLVNAGDNTSTLRPADLTIVVKCGATEVYRSEMRGVRPGTYTVDLTDKVQIGDNDVSITASWVDPNTGNTRTSTRAASIRVVALHLISQYDMTPMLENCGYDGLTEIRFRVTGSGSKETLLYIDGVQADSQTVPRGDTAASFFVDFATLSSGAHTLQVVASMTDADSGETVKSESLYIAAMRKGTQKGVGLHIVDPGGAIAEGAPSFDVKTFDVVKVQYGAYDTESATASATLTITGEPVRSLTVPRLPQTLDWRFTTTGQKTITVACGSVSQGLGVAVADSGINVHEKTVGLLTKLSAQGRSNSEAAGVRNVWADRGVSTTFEGVDWNTSGWTGDSLKLINGAKAIVGYRPFATNVGTTGLTVEMTLTIANVVREDVPIVHCVDTVDGKDKGFRIMGFEIAYVTGQTVQYKDEDGKDQEREMKLTTTYQSGNRIKVALVVESGRKVIHLYVNGNRAGADTYVEAYTFRQDSPKYLTFDSTAADIYVESVRIYDHAITDDEELMNDIADEQTIEGMLERYNDNDVLDELGAVDYTAIQRRGRGTILIVRDNLLNDVYAANDKKHDFEADVYYTPPMGLGEPFAVQNCFIRIQGTSSTKYPSKNIRFYLNKGPKTADKPLTMTIGGRPAEEGNKYKLRPTSIPVNLFTAKSDYSDSTMSLNTGGAKLFNEVLIELDLLTPPQRWQDDRGDDITVRAAIDGVPVDMFVARTADETPIYVGQYNLNNEKSKSEKIFGMELSGFAPSCPIALESLNNKQPLCLFQSGDDTEETLAADFDKAYEFNYPEDVTWSTATEDQQTAIARLFAWIKSVVPAGADSTDISTFESAEFVAHVADYFDVDYLLTYYLWTEFFVSVDQRAKNILWRTWDGLKWYPTYYDGDTQFGKSNDSFMSYTPDTERDTFDERLQQYAFQGHDSWLWNLCLANLGTELRECAGRLRAVLTPARVSEMLLGEQAGNWSDREYNKSGEIKYITPAVGDGAYGHVWPFIFALQGANREHTKWFIDRRWSLMDAKYAIGAYTSDRVPINMARNAGDAPSVITVYGTNVYSYGYGTANVPQYTTGVKQPGVPVEIPVREGYDANDPLFIYGASRIRKIDISACSGVFKNDFNVEQCTYLEEFDAHVPAGGTASTGWRMINLDKCKLLRVLNLNGQTGATTLNGGMAIDLSGLTHIETIDLRGTAVTALTLQPGAAVSTLWLPDTLQALTLDTLPALGAGLHAGSLAQVRSLAVTGCPSVNTLTVVQQWLSQAVNPQSLTLDGVNWTLTSQELLSDILSRVATVNLSGRIHIDGAVSLAVVERCKELFGVDCLSPGGSVHITFADEIILDDETQNPPLFAKCKAGNLCANEHYMTRTEAEAVTESTLYYAHFDGNLTIETADEFRYFTGLTAMPGDFFSMYGTAESARCLRTITIPPNVGSLREHFLYGCVRLERITFLPMRAPSFYSSGHFFDVGKAVTGQKIMEIPRGSTGYNNNTGNWANLASYTITYID